MSKSALSILILATALTAGCSTTYRTSAMTGMKTREISNDDKENFGYASGSGVVIYDVDENSEAYKKGVRENDMVKTVNGKAVRTPKDFEDAILTAADNSTVTIKTASANKQEKDVAVKKDAAKAPRKMTFGLSFPFLLYKGSDGTSVGHFNILRFRNSKDAHGFMLLELLGWVKKSDGWGVRILFFHFGSASIKPAKGLMNPDI